MDTTIIVIVCYFVVMCFLGLFIKNKISSDNDKSLSTLALAVSLIAALYGGGFILGGAELAYKYGWGGLAYGWSSALGLILVGIFMTKQIHRESQISKNLTVSSLLKNKFNNNHISLISAVLSVLALTAIAAAQLYAAMRIFNVLNLPIKLMLGITTFIIVIVSLKGLKGLVCFGKYNLIIASFGAIAAIALAWGITPNLSLNNQFEIASLSTLLCIIIPTALYILVGQDVHQKLYVAKSKKSLKSACFLAAFALILMTFFPVIIGIKSHYLFSINPSEAVPKFIMFSIPSIFKGLFIAAILAAIIGCAQSVISAASAQFSQDVIGSLRNYNPLKIQKINSLTTIFIALIAFLIAICSKSIINNLIIAYSLYTAGMFIPVILAFFHNKSQIYSKSIILISLTGIIASALIELKVINLEMPSILFGIGASFLTLLLFHLSSAFRRIGLQKKNQNNGGEI